MKFAGSGYIDIWKEVGDLADKTPESPREQKIGMAENLWLLYFNNTLFAQGLITEQERNQMAHRISQRKSSAKNYHPPHKGTRR